MKTIQEKVEPRQIFYNLQTWDVSTDEMEKAISLSTEIGWFEAQPDFPDRRCEDDSVLGAKKFPVRYPNFGSYRFNEFLGVFCPCNSRRDSFQNELGGLDWPTLFAFTIRLDKIGY
ncbi:MAG: hypothetical protein ACE5PV_27880 [Candidatus Poribacteria bacterium]